MSSHYSSKVMFIPRAQAVTMNVGALSTAIAVAIQQATQHSTQQSTVAPNTDVPVASLCPSTSDSAHKMETSAISTGKYMCWPSLVCMLVIDQANAMVT